MLHKRIEKLHRDNCGSTLLLVILCMFVVSLIGAMILSATLINYQMKLTQKQASDNFYDAEAVMEEFSLRVRQEVFDAYRDSYEKLLKNYMNAEIAENRSGYFLEWIAKELCFLPGDHLLKGSGIYEADHLGAFVEIKNYINTILAGRGELTIGASHPVSFSTEKLQMKMSGITLVFTDERGAMTTINTDLVLSLAMPDEAFHATRLTANSNLDDYVIISGSDLVSDATGTGGAGSSTAYVNGSLYAEGQLAVYSGLSIEGQRIVLGESLLLTDSATMQAVSVDKNYNGLWARNIELMGGSVWLQGNCYIADDTTFSAEGSSFTVTDGGYYGYSCSSEAEGDPSESSAIIINEPNITLDFSAADPLWIAGDAYIRETKLFDDISDSLPAKEGIMEGEAIAYKNLQSAYLLPGSCIVGVGHNPILMSQCFSRKQGETLEKPYMISEVGKVTVTEMIALEAMTIGLIDYAAGDTIPSGTVLPVGTILPSGTVLPCDVSTPIVDMLLNTKAGGGYFMEDGYYIDMTRSRALEGIDLTEYTDSVHPFTVRYSNTKGVAYYYLRFRNAKKAADYFWDYTRTISGRLLLSKMEGLGTSSILLPADAEKIMTIGNLLRYQTNALTGAKDYGVQGTDVGNDALLYEEAMLTSIYNSYLTKLTPNRIFGANVQPIASASLDIFSYLIDTVKFYSEDEEDRDTDPNRKLVYTLHQDADGNNIPFFVVSGREVETEELSSIAGNLDNAVILSDSAVIVNTKFSGVIITQGQVTLQVAGSSNAVSNGVTTLSKLILHDEIGPYFNGYSGTAKESNERVQMDVLLEATYENWKKQ